MFFPLFLLRIEFGQMRWATGAGSGFLSDCNAVWESLFGTAKKMLRKQKPKKREKWKTARYVGQQQQDTASHWSDSYHWHTRAKETQTNSTKQRRPTSVLAHGSFFVIVRKVAEPQKLSRWQKTPPLVTPECVICNLLARFR